MKPIIDVSQWQDPSLINYDLLCTEISGVMIRAGFTGYGDGVSCYRDAHYAKHYEEFHKRGVPCGFYWYSCATTKAQGQDEAQQLLKYIDGYEVSLPLAIDVEDTHHQMNAGRSALTWAITGFLETIERAGYYATVYSSTSWFQGVIDDSSLQKYDHWLAHWTYDPNMDAPYKGASVGMWQYHDKGHLRGYGGDLDLNKPLKDYVSLIAGMKEKRQNAQQGAPSSAKDTAEEFPPSWWQSHYSVFHRKNVRYTCLMDRAKIQEGAAHALTQRYTAAPLTTVEFPAPYIGHFGVDTAAEHRAPIYAGYEGKIIDGGQGHQGYGNWLMVQSGELRFLYCHMDELTASIGDTVKADTQIGYQGTTGFSTGSHLHVSVYRGGRLLDPLPYCFGESVLNGANKYETKPKEIQTLEFSPKAYTVATDLNIRSAAPQNGTFGEVVGMFKAGSVITIQATQAPEGAQSVWAKLADGLWVCAQDHENIYLTDADAPKYHVVKAGETPWSIAQQYGTTHQVIERLNGLSGNYAIYEGQKLRIQ